MESYSWLSVSQAGDERRKPALRDYAVGDTKSITLNLLQRWLRHADIATTAIYAEAVGAEEKQLAARLWE